MYEWGGYISLTEIRFRKAEEKSLLDGANSIESGATRLAGVLGMGDGKTLTIGTGAAGLASGSKTVAGTPKASGRCSTTS